MLKLLVISLLPTAFLFYYILKQDILKPEPPKKLATCFGLGMVGGIVKEIIDSIFGWLGFGNGYDTIFYGDFICTAICSGVFVACAYFILWKYSIKNPDFDEYLDGPVYASCIIFGMGVMSNLLSITSHEWAKVSLMSFQNVIFYYLLALLIGRDFSIAFFGDVEITNKTKLRMFAIPFAYVFVFDSLIFWCNKQFFTGILFTILLAIVAYLTKKKSDEIISSLKKKDIQRNKKNESQLVEDTTNPAQSGRD